MQFSISSLRGTAREEYKNLTLKKLYPERYLAACRKDVVPGRVVFLEIRKTQMTDNFRVISFLLSKEKDRWSQELVSICEGMADPVTVMRRCLAAIPKLATAQFIFVNESSYFLSSLPIRKETTVIQTWHACGAFKKFGYSTLGKGFGTTREDLERYPVHKNFDYVTVSSPEVIWAYAEAFHMEDRPEAFLPIGVSRTDIFFRRKYRARAKERLLKEVPETAGKTVVLYAPTFRGKVAEAVSPDELDLSEMKRELGSDVFLLVNHHPFVKKRPKISAENRDFAADVTGKLPVEELLCCADVLITDYSSIIFEYSLFEKPIIFFAYDLHDYRDERGFYYSSTEMMPGPLCMTTSEVIQGIKDAQKDFDLKKVRDFKYRFMSACDGHATERLIGLMKNISAGGSETERAETGRAETERAETVERS